MCALREQRANEGAVPTSISLSTPAQAGGCWRRRWRCRGRTSSCWNVAVTCECSMLPVLKYKIIRPSLLVSRQEGVAELSFTARIGRYSPSIHYLIQQGYEKLSIAAVEPNPSLLQTSAKGVVEVALECAHRTSTVSSCAFCEQEGHLTAPDLSFSGRALREQRKLLTPLRSPSDRAASASKKDGSATPSPYSRRIGSDL